MINSVEKFKVVHVIEYSSLCKLFYHYFLLNYCAFRHCLIIYTNINDHIIYHQAIKISEIKYVQTLQIIPSHKIITQPYYYTLRSYHFTI